MTKVNGMYRDSEKKNTLNWDVTDSVKLTRSATAPKDDYIGKIRKRLHEDSTAREEREKRRRKVLRDQMIAHETQEVSLSIVKIMTAGWPGNLEYCNFLIG